MSQRLEIEQATEGKSGAAIRGFEYRLNPRPVGGQQHRDQLTASGVPTEMDPPSIHPKLRRLSGEPLLVDEVFPEQPVRQWVLSFPYPLGFLFASQPAIMS